jgi:hypothetical protein
MAGVKKRKSTGEKPFKLTTGRLIALGIVAILVVMLYAPMISAFAGSLRQQNQLMIKFLPAYRGTTEELRQFSETSVGVADYSANIYVSFKNPSVVFGNNLDIQITVQNTGNEFHNAYYTVFLVNNTGDIFATFPYPNYVSSFATMSQWYSGQQPSNWIYPYKQDYNIDSNTLIARSALLQGSGNYYHNNVLKSGEIWLDQKIPNDPSQIGQWSVWVILSDDKYTNSMGTEIQSNKAITYTTAFFNVTPKSAQVQSQESPSMMYWATNGVTVFFLLVTVYGLFSKLSPWIDSNSKRVTDWWNDNRSLILISISLVIIYLILLLLKGLYPL